MKSRGEIRKVLSTAEGTEYLRKFFNEKVGIGNFEDWLEKVKKYRLGKKLNFEVHHVIPIKVFNNNPKLQKLLKDLGFGPEKFNGIENAIPLQKKRLLFDINGHSNHPDYDRFMSSEIDRILGDPNFDDLGKFEEIQKMINNMKNKLETEVLLGNKNVNDIISW